MVAPFQVQLGDSDLQDSLQHRPHRALGFMPELLEAIVAGVPRPGIEELNGLLETGIGDQLLLLVEPPPGCISAWRAS